MANLPPATSQVPVDDGKNKRMAIVSPVLGFVGLSLGMCNQNFCFVGIVGGILGLYLGIKGLKSSVRGIAITGIVLSSLSLLDSLAYLLVSAYIALGPIISDIFMNSQ